MNLLKLIFVFVFTIKLEFCFASQNSIRLSENGYSGIVVAFDENIAAEKRLQLLREAKDILSQASKQLFVATNGRAFFGEIEFLVPKSWQNNRQIDEIFDEIRKTQSNTILNADIVITNEASSLINQPLTIQYGTCGKPSLRILLTQWFILNVDILKLEKKAKTFIREWAHYRYGVFNEFGFAQDKIYPSHYALPGAREIKITSCTARSNASFLNVEIESINKSGEKCSLQINSDNGLPSESNANEACFPIPIAKDNSNNEEAVSSLMYSSHIETIDKFCDANNHNREAINKQNILCNGKSVTEVIEQHKDFDVKVLQPRSKTKFVMIEPDEPHVVLIVDVNQARSNNIGEVIKKYIWNMTKVDLFEYTSDSMLSLTKGTFAGHSSGAISLFEPLSPLLISTSHSEELQIIIITEGIVKDDDFKLRNLASEFVRKKARLNIIVYPHSSTKEFDKINLLATLVNGEVISVAEKLEGAHMRMDTALQLYKALKSFDVWKVNKSFIIKEQTFANTKSIEFSFVVDTSIVESNSTVSVFILYSDEPEFHKNIHTLSLEIGDKKYTYTEWDNERKSFVIKPPQVKSGVWHLNYKPLNPQQTFVAVAAVIPDKNSGLINVDCFLSNESRVLEISDDDPFIAYAFVSKGFYAYVESAKVTLTIYDSSGKVVQQSQMYDDGFGEPDITRGDGIYSTFITEVREPDHYRVVVTVLSENNTKLNSLLGESFTRRDAPRCCDSFIEPVSSVVISNLSRVKECGYFYLNKSVSKLKTFGSVKSLRVGNVDPNSGTVNIVFNAPFGKIKSLEFRFFKERESEYITAEKFGVNAAPEINYWIWDFSDDKLEPLEYGKSVDTSFKFPYSESGIYYFAMKISGFGRAKPIISNVVKFRMDSVQPKNETVPVLFVSSLAAWKVALIVSFSLLLIIVLLVLIICCVLLMRKKSKQEEENVASTNSLINGSRQTPDDQKEDQAIDGPLSPVQSWPAEVLLNHYAEVQQAKARKEPPPIIRLDDLTNISNSSNPSLGNARNIPISAYNFRANAPSENVDDVLEEPLSIDTSSESSYDLESQYGKVKKTRSVTQV
ncbi:calcium-activated chloride channel regulator 1-like isoform X2 [Dinothrombium tinctorium]|uniref:Calcium-activated chloride channel regulator 1-like isoform X2 n=1 Tax=Dinothrombium tinctorium TaxID=1965070 RepID=A0A443QS40_9ACAR|nr:calcium-activated chloride channel regulator 1-like isoform X2 [Dinothrombium tinctorium]